MKKRTAPRRDLFPQEYIVDFHATKAAIRCGYSKKTARSQGSELLTRPDIQKAIKVAIEKRSQRTQITADRVLQELAIIGFSDLKNHMDVDPDTGAIRCRGFDEMPGNSSRALEAIKENRVIKEDADGEKTTVYDKIEFKLHSKNQALELLGKHLGMFPSKVEAPALEDALNRNSMTIEGLRKSLAGYKKAKA